MTSNLHVCITVIVDKFTYNFTHKTVVLCSYHTVQYLTSSLSQASVDISGGFNAGSVISYTFIYNDGSVFPPTFVVPSANCSASVCEHVFNIPTSSVPPFYTVSVTATNVMGEGPVTISPLICEQVQ